MSISLDFLPQNQQDLIWNILIVDESHYPDIFGKITTFLADYTFQNYSLVFDYTDSLQSANSLLKDSQNIAVVIWILPSEPSERTENNFLHYIRNHLKNQNTRIIVLAENLRILPDESIFLTYDIQDYLLIQDLNRLKLVNQLKTALNTYQSLTKQTLSNQYFQIFEQELYQSQAKLAGMIELAEDAIISLDENQKITVFNQGAVEMFGYEPSEVMGQPIDILLPQRFVNIHRKHIQNFLASPETITPRKKPREIFCCRKDKSEFIAEASISRLMIDNSFILTVIVRDISKYRQKEAQLQETQAFLQTILDHLPVAVFVKDGRQETFSQNLYWNKTSEKIFDISAEQALGKTAYDLFPQEKADFLIQKDREVFEKGILEEIPLDIIDSQTLGKRFLHSRKLPLYTDNHQPKYLIGISEDITEKKLAEDERNYLAYLIEVSLNEIYIFDAQSLNFQYANRGALENIGYSLEQLKTMTLLDLKPEITQEEFEALVTPLRNHQQEILVFNTVHRRSDGSYYPIEIHLQLVERLEKKFFLAIVLDITEQKSAYDALQQAHDELEKRVKHRTHQLEKINAKLWEEIQNRSRIEEALRNLSLGVQTQTSQAFFESLVRYLARALNVEYALVSELILPDKKVARSIAFCQHGAIVDNIEYELKNTPCETVQQGQKCHYSGDVQHHFPYDDWLQKNNINSYMGLPLRNSHNEVIGIMCVSSLAPLNDIPFMQEILHIFAVRAETELERRQVEQRLRESEENFCQLTDNLNQVFYLRTFPNSQKMIYISPAFETIWGLSCEQLYENPLLWLEAIHPEDEERVKWRWQGEIGREDLAIEYQIIRPDGEIRWILDQCFPVHNSHGDVYRIAGLAEDITERKQIEIALQQLNQNLETLVTERTAQLQQEIQLHHQTEQALRESEKRWQLAVHGTNDGIWDWNLRTNEIFRSLRWKEMLGYQDTEIRNTLDEWRSLVHPEDLERVTEVVNAHLAGKTPYYQSEHRMRCKDGHYKWILDRGKAIWDETGKPIRVVGSHSDISERKWAEEALRKSEEKLRKITALVPGMVYQFGVSPNNRYFLTFASDGSTELFELTPEAVVEDVERIFARVKPEQLPAFREAIEASRQQLSEFSFDFVYLCPSGQEKWVRVHSLPQAIEDGNVIWNGIAWDISRDKQREDELKVAKLQAEAANQAKSEFLANMSHEIRTPMNAILGFCQLLQRCIDEPRARNYLNIVVASGKTLLALINDILDLSKIEAGKLELCYEPVDLRWLINEIQTLFSHRACQKNLFLLVDIDERLPEMIIFDEVRLRQILFNVVGNAIKFTEQGQVKMTVTLEKPPSSLNLPATIDLIIEVEDTGIGIEPEEQFRIFESFTQQEGQSNRKYGGSGLGLAITKRLTQMLGGTIQLDSQPNQGSTFTFRFREVEITKGTEIPLIPVETDDDLDQFAPATILAVDDVSSNLDLLKGYFYQTHHTLMVAHSGQEAIALTHRHSFDLIFLDLLMPEMNGYEVIKFLKNNPQTQSIPIIIVTASSLQSEETQIRSFCQGFLRKPISCLELVATMKSLLPLNNNLNFSSPPLDSSFELVSDFAPPSSAILQEQWQEKIQILLTLWKDTAKKRILKEIRQFNQQVEAIATEYHCQPLLNYTTLLRTQLETFDLDYLDQTIDQFPQLLQQLKDIK